MGLLNVKRTLFMAPAETALRQKRADADGQQEEIWSISVIVCSYFVDVVVCVVVKLMRKRAVQGNESGRLSHRIGRLSTFTVTWQNVRQADRQAQSRRCPRCLQRSLALLAI